MTKAANTPQPPGPSPGPAEPARQAGPLVATLLVAAILAAGAWWLVRQRRDAAAAAANYRGGAQAVPVVLGTVAQTDFPVFLEGIGTVQAYNSVTVRARVDGQLVKVAFTEGQDVQAGDVLAQVDPEPFRIAVEQAEARRAQDQAQFENATFELKRDTDLLAQKVVSQSAYDAQKAQVEQYGAAVQADQAAIDTARVQLKWATVTSPIAGRTGVRLLDQGNMVHAADPNGIVVITQLQPISVIFTLPEQNLHAIQAEMARGGLEAVAVGRDNQTPLARGRLAVIDNQIDTTTGSLKLKATFPNDDNRLWPGQFVNVRLHLATQRNVITTPAAVIQRGPDGPFVFVVQNGDSTNLVAKVRAVQIGAIRDGLAWVTNGLAKGEQVVVDGQYRLQEGTTVRPAKSAGAAEAGSEP